MVDSICKELKLKSNYVEKEVIKTIYFGGGTPSVLPFSSIQKIKDSICKHYQLSQDLEFTFECNPDDLTVEKFSVLKTVGVNRLSIGIQSFEDEQLIFMNRAHNSNEAQNCVSLAQNMGFNNITIDLIYGLPNTNEQYWNNQIKKALELNVNHISAYCLTIEQKTVFGNWHKKGQLIPLDDEIALNQFKRLQKELEKAGFEHYEISNFAKNGFISKHNSAYWLGEKYIGVGPSAHSFNGTSRQWNVSNNLSYIKSLENNLPYFETETLSEKDQFNEYILTRLRTKWGVNMTDLFSFYPQAESKTRRQINAFIKSKDLKINNDHIYLTEQGKFIADFISSELFI